jgi:rubrerythrin
MTNEERQRAIEWMKGRPVMMAGAKKMYDLAVEALEAYVPDMNDGNMISRQAAIDIVTFECGEWQGLSKEITKQINALPQAQPERGKWLPDNRCGGGYWVCSSCKHPTEAFAADVLYKYCPFCGADMRTKERDYDYERAVEQLEHDMLYEPTFNQDDGSM